MTLLLSSPWLRLTNYRMEQYLGVPLIDGKMRASDFAPLLEKVESRFRSWSAKRLSFAGRLQLLHSVINSMINFWASIFILPTACLISIEQLCNAFLWSGSTDSARSAKISWETVCTPKRSGGLGLRRLVKWNIVLCLKLIWMLFTNSGSLWVSWVKSHLVGSSNFWSVSCTSGSWMWQKLLNLRPTARSFIFCHVGSGTKCSFWEENWTGLGPLLHLTGPASPRISGIPLTATVSQAITGNRWRLSQRSRNPIITFLRASLPDASHIAQNSSSDRFSWIPGVAHIDTNDPLIPFSSASTFSALSPPPPEVPWHDQVWFSGRIPRHTFITWLAVHDRLQTRDRIRRYSPSSPSICILCLSANESRDHLFFDCHFSFTILTSILHFTPTHRLFSDLMQWLPRCSSSRFIKLIGLLLFQAAIYTIWRERNTRIHSQTARTVADLVREITFVIKAKLAGIPVTDAVTSPLTSWFNLQTGALSFSN